MNEAKQKELETIKRCIEAGQYKEAITLVRKAKHSKGTIHLGILYIWIGTNTLNRALVNKGVKLAEKNLNDKKLHEDYIYQARYNLGNGYNTLFTIGEREGKDFYSLDRYIKKARSNFQEVPFRHQQFAWAQTNLGNLMDDIGRPAEAINFYETALKKDSKHAMATGNLALAIERMAPISEYSTAFLVFAYQRLNKALVNSDSIVRVGGQEALDRFTHSRDRIKEFFNSQGKSKILSKSLAHPHRDDSSLSEFVKFYTNFCADNDLYLNLHLHDSNSDASIGDSVIVRPVVPLTDNEATQDIFFRLNEIKESYMTARYLLAQSQFTNDDTRTISEQTLLINPADYSVSNLYVGLLKGGYKETIGVLDKVAILLSHYLELRHEETNPRLDYRKVWYENLSKKYGINQRVIKYGNRYLYGVYSLCNEISDIDGSVRNALTHRYVRVYRTVSGPQGTHTFEEITEKTMHLQYLAKCTIISLANFINTVEAMKITRAREDGKVVPSVPLWSDQMLDAWG